MAPKGWVQATWRHQPKVLEHFLVRLSGKLNSRSELNAGKTAADVLLAAAAASVLFSDAEEVDLLFEFACSDSSALGVVAAERGAQAHRLTLAAGDISTREGLDKAVSHLQATACAHPNKRLHAHGSLPCTPTSVGTQSLPSGGERNSKPS